MNNKKYGFTNIGYIENLTTYMSELRKLTGIDKIDIHLLNENIENVWANKYEQAICLNSNLESTDTNGNDISFLLINTGLFDSVSKEPVYGGFISTNGPTNLADENRKWSGVTLGTKEKITSIWENLPFVKKTELDQHTSINTYTGLAAYISRITNQEYTPLSCKKMLNDAFLFAKAHEKLGNCKNQICYFQIPEISNKTTTYYAYSKRNNRYPEVPTEWFGLYIESETELIDKILDIGYVHMADMIFEDTTEVNRFLIELGNKAMKENWVKQVEDGEKPSAFVYPILKSYLSYTYHHLQDEDHLLEEEDKKIKKYSGKAYFNTGLLDRYFRQIFIVGDIDYIQLGIPFSEQEGNTEKEILRNVRFYSENDPQITRVFPKHQLPKMACYFKDRSDVIFDASLDIHFNDEHIFIDGVARKRLPKYIDAYTACKDDTDKISVLASKIARDFESACDRAKLLAERNYKLAVPQYWKETGEIQFLLPIYLGEDEEADVPQCALVLSLDNSARNVSYRGETILTLNMAYNNARLLAKPDVFWLNDLG